MTVQELIDELNEIKNKDIEVKYISNQTLEYYVVVDTIETVNEYIVYLEFK